MTLFVSPFTPPPPIYDKNKWKLVLKAWGFLTFFNIILLPYLNYVIIVGFQIKWAQVDTIPLAHCQYIKHTHTHTHINTKNIIVSPDLKDIGARLLISTKKDKKRFIKSQREKFITFVIFACSTKVGICTVYLKIRLKNK